MQAASQPGRQGHARGAGRSICGASAASQGTASSAHHHVICAADKPLLPGDELGRAHCGGRGAGAGSPHVTCWCCSCPRRLKLRHSGIRHWMTPLLLLLTLHPAVPIILWAGLCWRCLLPPRWLISCPTRLCIAPGSSVTSKDLTSDCKKCNESWHLQLWHAVEWHPTAVAPACRPLAAGIAAAPALTTTACSLLPAPIGAPAPHNSRCRCGHCRGRQGS